jgi:hypothetical protein
MKPARFAAIALLVAGLAGRSAPAAGYDLITHARVSERAFDTSEQLPRFFEDAGIEATDVFDPDAQAPDPERSAAESLRFISDYQTNDGTPRGWFIAGAIREDDYRQRLGVRLPLLRCDQPLNPPSAIDRPIHHFFDVQRDGGGLVAFPADGLPALDWALGLQGRGPADDQNHFSLPDARDYQLRSLTEAGRVDRERSTAKLFRALGQVAHVLQDMAQPQHVRNDPHPTCDGVLPRSFLGERSWYELYVETRAKQIPFRFRPDVGRLLFLSGGRPATFTAYRDYWTNGSHAGLADFSSRNFLSAGTNFGSLDAAGRPCGGLPQPVCDPDDPSYERHLAVVTRTSPTGRVLSGLVEFFRREIRDPLTGAVISVPDAIDPGTSDKVRVSSRSLWDEHLSRLAAPHNRPRFSLNIFNHDEVADALLPRAVGYSAGLLDSFFRGRIDAAFADHPTDPTRRLVRPINRSADPLGPGRFTLYVDGADGTRTAVPGAIVGVNGDVATDQEAGETVIPTGLEPSRLTLVYEGTLGQEPGAIIGKVRLGRPGVEELFIDQATGDLYFRNRAVLTRLNVLERLTPAGATLGRVVWGNDGVSFMVSVATNPFSGAYDWAVFELSERPAKDKTWETAPTARLLRQEPFDVAWTAAVGAGVPDEVFTVVLDGRREILYGGHRGRAPDPSNYKGAVLVNHSTRTTLIDYGIALVGELGGGSVPYIVHADGARLAESVVIVKSFAYLDLDLHPDALIPFRTSLWVGSAERVLHADTVGAPANHELDERPFGGPSLDPVWPHSSRRHLLYSVLFTDATDRSQPTSVVRVYLHDVKTGVSRVVAEDPSFSPTPQVDRLARYDVRGSANTGVDRLFQASSVNLLDGTLLPEGEREQFLVAWDRTTGAPLLDVTAGIYPPLDVAARDLAMLVPLPADRTHRGSPVQSRAVQVLE